jgi:hypothetical protein
MKYGSEEARKRTQPVFRSRRFAFFISYLLLFTYYLLLPTKTSAQGHYHTQGSSNLQIYPDTIDFGRVRIGEYRDSYFSITNPAISSTTIELTSINFWESLKGSEFIADSLDGNLSDSMALTIGSIARDTIHFHSKWLGLDKDSIPIYWRSTNQKYFPITVYLLGTGVAPNVISSGYNFGNWRVDSASPMQTLLIANVGSDTTAIDSVTIMDSTEIKDSDFLVTLDSLPPSGPKTSALRIGYEGGDSTLSFTVQFHPHSLGSDSLIIRIHTIDGDTLFDTIRGRGVEPHVLVNPNPQSQVIDFGTITLAKSITPPSPRDTFFVISNASGNYEAVIDTLVDTDTAGNFNMQINQPITSHDTLAAGSVLIDSVRFNITQEGDFVDTIRVPNDTRYALYPSESAYQPLVIVKAKVRTGPIGNFVTSFDTITTCDTVRDTVTITNPYPVEVYIDTILLVSDTAGFSYGQNSFVQKISMPPNGNFSFKLAYNFPPDSLNGPQALKMLLFQRRRDNDSLIVDTVTASLIRKEQVLTLQAKLPAPGVVGTSAADVSELRLPILLQGPRSGVNELNSWTLTYQFSNDLFTPTGVDVTGSLCPPGSLFPYWDQSSRTYTIVATGTAVSDPALIKNDLLFTLLLQASVTTDTVVTVTPNFTWKSHPCAYNLQSFTLSLPYSNDCGDQTIRDVLLRQTPSFIVTGIWPNPANKYDGVSVSYRSAEPCEVTTTVYNMSGEEIGHFMTMVVTGAGTIALPEQLIPASGPAFVRVEAVDAKGNISAIQSCKIAVLK